MAGIVALVMGCDSLTGSDGGEYQGVLLFEPDQVNVRLDRVGGGCLCQFAYDVDESAGAYCESYSAEEISSCVGSCGSPCVSQVVVSAGGSELGSAAPDRETGFARVPIAAEPGAALEVEVRGCAGTQIVPAIVPMARPAPNIEPLSVGGGEIRVNWSPNDADRACAVAELADANHYCCGNDDGDIGIAADPGGDSFGFRLERFWDLGIWQEGDSSAHLWQLDTRTVR